MTKKIEGIRVDVTFGHYETDESSEHTFLSPDFRYEGEITIAIAPISKQILACKKVGRSVAKASIQQIHTRLRHNYHNKGGKVKKWHLTTRRNAAAKPSS